jgi:hypothetical protein
METPRPFAYLAQGKLFCTQPGRAPERIESPFVQGIEDRRASERERRGYRAQGMMWNLGQPPEVSQMMEGMPVLRVLRFTSVTGGPRPQELYYALQTETIGGLFHFNLADGYERRLVHRQQLELRDLARCPKSGDLACSLRTADGGSHIGLMDGQGGKLREITRGDSIDESPSWSLIRERTLLFQSAAVGRHEDGAIFGLAPCSISQLDLASESLTIVLENPQFDYLSPRQSADGTLFFIRRPYQVRPPTSMLRVAGDVALFPFRVARAMVHFLDAFSRMFSRKPLMTAGGPKRDGPDQRYVQLWGRWIEVKREMTHGRGDADPPLVPGDWHLIRRLPDGTEISIATHVAAFDVNGAGDVLYTNGSSIHFCPAGGNPQRVGRARLVERVSLLE